MDTLHRVTFFFFFGVCFFCGNAFATYESNNAFATTWLSGKQNRDGSWGATETQKFLLTIEAVQALRAVGNRNKAYYQGITWLENHAATNADYRARRALTLNTHGDDVTNAIATLESAQNTTLTGHAAWGASEIYHQAPLDTALVLNGLNSVGTTANVQAAINYLKSAQLSGADQGWPIATESSSEPFVTAMVIKTLVPLQGQDASLSININNALATLSSTVTISSPLSQQGHAAHAALLANDTATAQPWLNNLAATQSADGSWGGEVYSTALAMRAFAVADGVDTLANQSPVVMLNANLRAAVNKTLGRNVMDDLDRSELLRLTSLAASNLTIDDLTGLEWAVNLTTLDLRNNDITSTTPIDGLTQLTTLLLAGNPVGGGGTIQEVVPTVPESGLIIMALLLLVLGTRLQRNYPEYSQKEFAT